MRALAEINKLEEKTQIEDLKEYLSHLKNMYKECENGSEIATDDLIDLMSVKIKCVVHKTNIIVYTLTNVLCLGKDEHNLAEVLCEIKEASLQFKLPIAIFLKDVNKISQGRFEYSLGHIKEFIKECEIFVTMLETQAD